MSISYAMQTGVSGLKANSSAVGRISENIANANTDGYRRSFVQMVTTSAQSDAKLISPSGVQAVQGADITTDGALRATGNATDLAIGGSGFFIVTAQPNETNEANFFLTRAGSFKPDENGNLRNAAGYYLAGYPIEAADGLGAVDRNGFGDLSTVNLGGRTQNGAPTGSMSLAGNLPAQQTGLAEESQPFLSSAEYFTSLGAAERMQFSWQPSEDNRNQWTLSIADAAGESYGSVTVDFHDSGDSAGAPLAYSAVTSTATAPAGFAFDPATGTATLTVNNGATPQTVEIELGAPGSFEGMTQFAGDYSPLNIDVDGSESGTMVRTEVDENGDVFGIYDNGSRRALYNIPLAEVANPAGLRATDGNAYALSLNSGQLSLGRAGVGSTGNLTAGALESSNVEVAQELTDLITTQRAYSSNAKIITTVDEMLDETARLKR